MPITPLLAFWTPGPLELFVILLVALLLFGKRLPEVGRSLGKGLVEFKRGIAGIEDDFDQKHPPSSSNSATTSASTKPVDGPVSRTDAAEPESAEPSKQESVA